MTNSGNGYPRGTDNWLITKLSDIERQIRNLAAPTGTQTNSLVDQVQSALASIRDTIAKTISEVSYTREQTDSKIGSTPAGQTVNGAQTVKGNQRVEGNSTVTGAATVESSMTIAGSLRGSSANFPAGINSTNARSNVVVTNYASLWVDGAGQFGISPSTVNSKTEIDTVNLQAEVDALYILGLVSFKYNKAVEEYGEEAPTEVGTIAEYAEKAGLGRWVIYDEDGEVIGVNYERLTIPLIATVQDLNKRLKVLEANVATAETVAPDPSPITMTKSSKTSSKKA